MTIGGARSNIGGGTRYAVVIGDNPSCVVLIKGFAYDSSSSQSNVACVNGLLAEVERDAIKKEMLAAWSNQEMRLAVLPRPPSKRVVMVGLEKIEAIGLRLS